MSEIIRGLFLGAVKDVDDSQFITHSHISGIISCCNRFDYGAPPDGVEQLRIDVEDISAEPILDNLDQAVRFIERHTNHHSAVLVHCRSGVSRSATIVIGYLMRSLHMTLRDAFMKVIQSRPCVCPNIGFMHQLVALERQIQHDDDPSPCSTLNDTHEPDGGGPLFFSPLSSPPMSPPTGTSSSVNANRLRVIGQALMRQQYQPAKPRLPPIPSGGSTRAAASTPPSPHHKASESSPQRGSASTPQFSTPGEAEVTPTVSPTSSLIPSLSMAKYISWYTAHKRHRAAIPSLAP